MPTTLTQRDLNRATLARQHLLARTTTPALAMIEHLAGMQAQLPRDPYLGLWSRLDGFEAEDLAGLLRTRQATRAPFMRSTIHLTSAADAAMLFTLLEAFQYQRTMTGTPFGKRLRDLDHDALRRAAREVVEESPRSTAELGPLLVERFPGHDGEAMAIAATRFLPMVQVTPRGLWRESGQTRWTTAEAWLGMPMAESPSRQDLVLRYLAALGPASVMDMQNWSGLTKLKGDFEALRPDLITFQDEQGKELFDLPDAPRPTSVTPAPVRFLPVYDNVVLGHANRSRFFAADTPIPENAGLGRDVGTILVDGFVRGLWKLETAKRTATLRIQLLDGCPADAQADVAAEGERLLAFLADNAATQQVVFDTLGAQS
ncbi:MAG: winged helix DNA-binding domain-containing protein [Chloroflexota bacterium]|nr:winged helix DNA-binding domain-containing protein [Chloroflexota bacterium]